MGRCKCLGTLMSAQPEPWEERPFLRRVILRYDLCRFRDETTGWATFDHARYLCHHWRQDLISDTGAVRS